MRGPFDNAQEPEATSADAGLTAPRRKPPGGKAILRLLDLLEKRGLSEAAETTRIVRGRFRGDSGPISRRGPRSTHAGSGSSATAGTSRGCRPLQAHIWRQRRRAGLGLRPPPARLRGRLPRRVHSGGLWAPGRFRTDRPTGQAGLMCRGGLRPSQWTRQTLRTCCVEQREAVSGRVSTGAEVRLRARISPRLSLPAPLPSTPRLRRTCTAEPAKEISIGRLAQEF